MARLLLDRGADPAMRDTFPGWTSLEIARAAVKGDAADRPRLDRDYEGVIRILTGFDDD